jgi:hypothetical protein
MVQRPYCIVNLLRKHALTMKWEAFTDRCKLHACEELVYSYLLLTAEFYGVELPTEIKSKYSQLVTPDNCEKYNTQKVEE